MTLLRWAATLAAPVVAYVACVVLAIGLLQVLTGLCPRELIVSGACTAPWAGAAELAAMCVALAVGAALFVVLPAWCAPAHRRAVAWACWTAGAALVGSAWWQIGASFAAPSISALVAGALAVAAVRWRTRAAPAGAAATGAEESGR